MLRQIGVTPEEAERLSIPDAAVVMELDGQNLTAADFEAAIAEGFPVNPDGTISLNRFVSWMLEDHVD